MKANRWVAMVNVVLVPFTPLASTQAQYVDAIRVHNVEIATTNDMDTPCHRSHNVLIIRVMTDDVMFIFTNLPFRAFQRGLCCVCAGFPKAIRT